VTDISILELDRGEVLRAFPDIGRVYHEAFNVPDTATTQRFLDNGLSKHVAYPEFRLLVAQADDGVVGFCYGYRSVSGTWWRDTVGATIAHEAGKEWLEDAFEFVEFAVLPASQGLGIGSALHDGLLGSVVQLRALLSTDANDNPARDFYERRGWVDLVTPFHYPGGTKPASLMGLDLAAWRENRAAKADDVE
jgi:ribosomal protein S18 acetylase RimI-like enzyme